MNIAKRWYEEEARLLPDAEVDMIREELDSGIMGPVLKKWLHQLLIDRELRVAREAALIRQLEEQAEELRSLEE